MTFFEFANIKVRLADVVAFSSCVYYGSGGCPFIDVWLRDRVDPIACRFYSCAHEAKFQQFVDAVEHEAHEQSNRH